MIDKNDLYRFYDEYFLVTAKGTPFVDIHRITKEQYDDIRKKVRNKYGAQIEYFATYTITFYDYQNKLNSIKVDKKFFNSLKNLQVKELNREFYITMNYPNQEDDKMINQAISNENTENKIVDNSCFMELKKILLKEIKHKDLVRFYKYFIEGQTLKEIAESEGVSEQAVFYNLKNVRKKLAKNEKIKKFLKKT